MATQNWVNTGSGNGLLPDYPGDNALKVKAGDIWWVTMKILLQFSIIWDLMSIFYHFESWSAKLPLANSVEMENIRGDKSLSDLSQPVMIDEQVYWGI